MTIGRWKPIAAALLLALTIVLLWSNNSHRAALRNRLDQADREVGEAKAAADRAGHSASEAIDAATAAQNKIPDSS